MTAKLSRRRHLYMNQRGDYFVAHDDREALDLARAFYADLQIPLHPELLELAAQPDEAPMPFEDDKGLVITRLAREWAAESPVGFFGGEDV
jgi:hypothetical protein